MTTLAALILTLIAGFAVVAPLVRRRSSKNIDDNPALVWQEQYRGALADLQDLDMDWQLGNLSDEDYAALRDVQRRRAAEALRELDLREEERARMRARIEAELDGSLTTQLWTEGVDPARGGSRASAIPRPKVALIVGTSVTVVAVIAVVALYFRLSDVQARQSPIAALPLTSAHTALIDSSGDYWLGHREGLLRSSDARSWRSAGLDGDVMAIVVSPDGSQRVALGRDVQAVSTDGGTTWMPLGHDLPGTDVRGAAIGGTGIWAYVVGAGVFRSQDGARWQATGPPVAQDVSALAALPAAGGDIVFLVSGGGLARSADGGRTWAPAAGAANLALSGVVRTVTVDPSRGLLYAGTTQGLFRSASSGAEWTKLPFVGSPAAIGARGDRLLVVDDQGHLFLSSDSGGTWAP